MLLGVAFILGEFPEDVVILAFLPHPFGMTISEIRIGAVGAVIVIDAGVVVGIKRRIGIGKGLVVRVQ